MRNKKPLDQFLQETIALCPSLSKRMKNAQLTSPVEATGNYSYVCDRTHGSNYLLLGDAYAFIDPVFSSGVMLAMQSAFIGADTVDTCLRNPRQAAAALKQFDKAMKIGPKEFSWFIYRVTNPTMRNMFMEPSNIFRVMTTPGASPRANSISTPGPSTTCGRCRRARRRCSLVLRSTAS